MPIVTDYFGKDITQDESWQLEMRVNQIHREDEAGLQRSRWFDYRNLLPAQATYLFAAQYRHEYLSAYRHSVDIRTVDQVRPFSPDDIFRSPELISMWLARREADRIGVKYDFFLSCAFGRFYNRGWRSFPRPNQLYAEELVLDIRDTWKARCAEVLTLAENPFFLAENYVGHPDQDQYRLWLVAQVNTREHKHMTLSRLIRAGHLPVEVASKFFDQSVIKRATM